MHYDSYVSLLKISYSRLKNSEASKPRMNCELQVIKLLGNKLFNYKIIKSQIFNNSFEMINFTAFRDISLNNLIIVRMLSFHLQIKSSLVFFPLKNSAVKFKIGSDN